jgi:hypothetical protein
MRIRRPLAALLAALALAGCGALTACSAVGGSNTGVAYNTVDTQGGNPTGAAQGDLPLNSNKQVGSNPDRAGGHHP